MARRRRIRVRPVSGLSLNRMIPNLLTMLALCAGMTAIRLAIDNKFESAAISVIIAGILDGLDGRIARLLKGTSPFGAQLDSLSDFVSFGVAPAVMLYLWTMQQLAGIGWVLVLLFGACCALRLARFNTQIGAELPPYAYNFFTGVPAPMGAFLVMLPLFLSFEFGAALFRGMTLQSYVTGKITTKNQQILLPIASITPKTIDDKTKVIPWDVDPVWLDLTKKYFPKYNGLY
jgi:CDP-diacylglycerol--serine O-phosphatidyltransferase